ncbi:uncharacterized protein [Periplaneta americana]|uniref:uncharacterized protein n=1 Tax=Periplaneta americana TaxID=6978 RepID=UPI0037E936CF
MTVDRTHPVLTLVVVLLLSFIGTCVSAPVVGEEIVYDQRQNGSENIRVHVNGIVIVHAPLEALVALASVSDESALQQQLLEILGGISTTTAAPNATTESESPTETDSTSDITSEDPTSTSLAPAAASSSTPAEEKPAQEESQKPHKKNKPRLRLANLLMPFLRRL